MALTHTRFVEFAKLKQRGKSGATVVRLMMAANDLGFANEALSMFNAKNSPSQLDRRDAARRYFLRMQLSHLRQGMKVIGSISNDRTLSAVVAGCDAQTRADFEQLRQFLPNGQRANDFKKWVQEVRNNVGFHYDEDKGYTEAVIADRADRGQVSSITRGNHCHLWFFKVADEIVDSIVCRQIWRIPREASLREETDQVATELYGAVVLFVDFAGEFIWKYCAEL